MVVKISNNILMGFEFDDEELYNQSKRELDNIMKIKKSYNIKNKASLLQFYNKLIEEKIFQTPVGIEYLRDIQKELYSTEGINNEDIRAIPVPVYADKAGNTVKGTGSQNGSQTRSQKKYIEKYKDLYIKMVIINVVLLITICAMFIITKHSEKYDLDYYRESIENDYLDWENHLRERESRLNTNHNSD